jgi:hypothetical protein
MRTLKIPIRYIPSNLTRKDKQNQLVMLLKSRHLYNQNKYYTRKNVPSYKYKQSNHILNARKIYNVDTIAPNKELAEKTGCKISALNEIVKKGEGAYYSSGSRPNQTPQSWGIARLASALTSGKATAYDYNIIDKGCNHKMKAYILANHSRKNFKTRHALSHKIGIGKI